MALITQNDLLSSHSQSNNGTDILASQPMTWRQVLTIIVIAAIMVVDGIDILSMGLAAPGIVAEFNLSPQTLGWVLSMELIGTAIGAIVLGGMADWIGRRRTILWCLLPMALGMWGASQAQSISALLMWRLLTGVGIGLIVPAISAAAAEFSNMRSRNLTIAFLVVCYPIGGALAGIVGRQLLVDGTWRDVMTMGMWATVAFVPIVWFLVPESVPYLDRTQPQGALARINRTLVILRHPTAVSLRRKETGVLPSSFRVIFGPRYIRPTLLLSVVAIAHITSMYFALKWAPQIVVNLGFKPSEAAGVLMWVNLGSIMGGAVFGLMASRISTKYVAIGVFLGASVTIVAFGRGAASLPTLSLLGATVGFFTFSGLVGIYTLLIQHFPTEVRATANGFVLGIGRGISALAPVLVGIMFGAGYTFSSVALVMSLGSLIAAVALIALRLRPKPLPMVTSALSDEIRVID